MYVTEIAGTVSAVVTLTTKLTELVNKVKAKPPKEAKAAIGELQDLALTLQSRLLELQAQALSLQSENADLREQIRQQEKRALEREKYERRRIGSATVVVPKDDPETYLCASCYAAGRLVYLDALSESFRGIGTHRCPSCDSVLTIRP